MNEQLLSQPIPMMYVMVIQRNQAPMVARLLESVLAGNRAPSVREVLVVRSTRFLDDDRELRAGCSNRISQA